MERPGPTSRLLRAHLVRAERQHAHTPAQRLVREAYDQPVRCETGSGADLPRDRDFIADAVERADARKRSRRAAEAGMSNAPRAARCGPSRSTKCSTRSIVPRYAQTKPIHLFGDGVHRPLSNDWPRKSRFAAYLIEVGHHGDQRGWRGRANGLGRAWQANDRDHGASFSPHYRLPHVGRESRRWSYTCSI